MMVRSSHKTSHGPASVVLLAGLGVLATACATSAAAPSTTTTTIVDITTTTVHYVPTYVTVGTKKVLMPVEAHNEPISPYSNEGQNIVVVPSGFEPSKLYAVHKHPIVFTNLTTRPAIVVFYNFPNYPKPITIPSGGHVAIHYNAQISLAYTDGSHKQIGRLYIDTLPGLN